MSPSVQMADRRTLILREMAVAAALGAWRGGWGAAMAVGLTTFVVVLTGSLVGRSLAFRLNRLGLEPATASGPLVATISDRAGVLIYFIIGSAILGF